MARSRWRRATRIGIAGYWLLIFIATHVPPGSGVGSMPTSDKLLHFVAYGVLGLLLPLWRSVALTPRRLAGLFLLIIAYGAVDELLQIPVGRTAEWWDWWADVGGAAAGLGTSWSMREVHRRMADRRKPSLG